MERAGRQLKALAEQGPLGVPFSLRLGGVVAAALGLDTPRAGGQGDCLGKEGVKGPPVFQVPAQEVGVWVRERQGTVLPGARSPCLGKGSSSFLLPQLLLPLPARG